MRIYRKITAIFIVGINVLIISGCQTNDFSQDISNRVETQKVKEYPEETPESEEQITLHTGVETEITESDQNYPYLDELNKYIEQKQFALLKIDSIFGGEERNSWEWNWDEWDIVRPLNNISSAHSGYCKIDYNNDGIEEILYRNMSDEMEVTVYTIDYEKNEINGEYELMSVFPTGMSGEGVLRQLWFKKIGDEIITFCFYQEDELNDFSIYSYQITSNENDTDVKLLEKRVMTVVTEIINAEDVIPGQDIFDDVYIDYVSEETDVYLLSQDELNSYQKNRVIWDEGQIKDLPEEFVEVLKKLWKQIRLVDIM